jgi:hypothetical protein
MSFHTAYFNTRFRTEQPAVALPARFVVVTAYATTGERWTQAENTRADSALAQHLAALGVWHCRITGYDPATGHAEPGWAVEVTREAGLELGRAFRQDAIYWLDGEALWVVSCHGGDGAPVGVFADRLDQPS